MNAEGGHSLYRPGCFRVGVANDPQETDPVFANEQHAVECAQSTANALGFYVPVVVWDVRAEPLWVFILGEQFRRL
jgi:hypothetical protein